MAGFGSGAYGAAFYLIGHTCGHCGNDVASERGWVGHYNQNANGRFTLIAST